MDLIEDVASNSSCIVVCISVAVNACLFGYYQSVSIFSHHVTIWIHHGSHVQIMIEMEVS
jgi:hypothetical protein